MKPSLLLIVIFIFSSSAFEYAPPSPTPSEPPWSPGIANPKVLRVGRGIAKPLLCAQYYNGKALSKLLKERFKIDASVSNIKQIDSEHLVECPEHVEWENFLNDAPCEANFYEMNGFPIKEGKQQWEELTCNSNLPEGVSYVAAAGKSKFSIILISSKMKNQEGDGKVTLNYWLSRTATLTMCLFFKCDDFESPMNCTSPVRRGQVHEATFEIKGPIDQPFKIAILASNFEAPEASLAVVSNLKYRAEGSDCDSFDENKSQQIGMLDV